jgi:hypothetical protein
MSDAGPLPYVEWTPPPVTGLAAPVAGERVRLVITSGVVELQPCGLYASHFHPMPEKHHVVPESWWVKAGKPVASPMKLLCPNCHYSTHVALDGILRGLDVGLLPPRCVVLAREGIAGAEAAGLTPALTL